MKILLLEDNNRLNNSIVKRLKLKGYKVDSFTDGNQALHCAFDGYDCFILDINVPSIDGVTILKEIRENDKNIPILIISSNISSFGNVKRIFSRFFKCYFLRKGYKEGRYGFFIALCAGLYPIWSYLKAKK